MEKGKIILGKEGIILKKPYLWVGIMLFLFAIDRISKIIVINEIGFGKQLEVVKDKFYLSVHGNTGAAWGILENGRYVFIVLTLIMLAFIVYFTLKNNNTFFRVATAILTGGAMGNFIDRVLYGKVTDYLQFYVGEASFPTFNFADMMIVTGTILIGIYIIFIYKDKGAYESGGVNKDKCEGNNDRNNQDSCGNGRQQIETSGNE